MYLSAAGMTLRAAPLAADDDVVFTGQFTLPDVGGREALGGLAEVRRE
jgi:hypothetical protein